MHALLIISIILVLVFAVTNGMKDGSNVSATAIASHSLSRLKVTLIVAAAELGGPFLLGTKVAATVARNIINPQVLPGDREGILLILSGLAGALIWNGLTWFFELPTSSSLTMVGGLIGPVFYTFGWTAIPWAVFLFKVVLAMFLSPIVGFFFGYAVHKLVNRLLRKSTLGMNVLIKKVQVFTLIILGANHGTNDSQKAMGIIALLLFVAGRNADIAIPFWVKLASILAITVGVTMGGTKIVKTVGYGIFKIHPYHSLESQLAAAGLLFACNIVGAPVSSTQIISSSVIGVGSGFRKSSVRWNIIRSILWSWLVTIPLAASISILVYLGLKIVLPY